MNEKWNDFKDGFTETFLFGFHGISANGIGAAVGLIITVIILFASCAGFIIVGEMIFPSGG